MKSYGYRRPKRAAKIIDSMDDCFDFMTEPLYGFRTLITSEKACFAGKVKIPILVSKHVTILGSFGWPKLTIMCFEENFARKKCKAVSCIPFKYSGSRIFKMGKRKKIYGRLIENFEGQLYIQSWKNSFVKNFFSLKQKLFKRVALHNDFSFSEKFF